LIIKKRKLAGDIEGYDFYGDFNKGYFSLDEKKCVNPKIFLTSIVLFYGTKKNKVEWIIVKELKSGRIITWPHIRQGYALKRLNYFEYKT
jgi:hypothetical protein